MRALLRAPAFRRLLIGQTISAFGDWVATIGLMVLALDVSGSSAAVGGVLVLRLAPGAVAGPLAAAAIRRFDRKATMLAADAVRVVMAAALPVIPGIWWTAPHWLSPIGWIYLWALLIEVASLVFVPARDSAIPEVVGDGDLGIANGLVLGSSYGMIPIGAAALGGLLALGSAVGLHGDQRFIVPFALDAVTYAVSFLAIARIPSLGARASDGAAGAGPLRFRDALRVPLVRAVLPGTAAVSLGVGALFSVGVRFVERVLGATATQFGVLIAVFGVGAAAGLVGTRWLRGDRLTGLRRGVAVLGAVIAGMSLAPTIGLAYLGALVFGAAATATLVTGMTLLQEALGAAERELGFAVFHIVIRSGLGAAAVLAGVAADALGASVFAGLAGSRIVLLAAGALVLSSAALVRSSPVRTSAPDCDAARRCPDVTSEVTS